MTTAVVETPLPRLVSNISAQDIANHTNAGSVSGGAASGPSIITTGNPGVAIFGVSSGCTAVPASGNEYTAGGTIFSNTADRAILSVHLGSGAFTILHRQWRNIQLLKRGVQMRNLLSLALLMMFTPPVDAQSNLVAFMNLGGTSGSTPTATTLAGNTCASVSQSWSVQGSATFTYQTASSWPLVAPNSVTLKNNSVCTDTSTTGVQMQSAGSANGGWNWGVTNTAISVGSVIGASVNYSTNLPATDNTHYDTFNLVGQQNFSTNDYMNAMSIGGGALSMECSTGQDLSVSQAPVATVPGNSYNIEFIWNPATGSVTVSGTTVMLNSGTNFSSALLNGLAKIYIGGQATANAYTVGSVNSGTSLTLSGSGPANGTYTYYAPHYMKVRVGWINPFYAGIVISTQYCANAGGVDADVVFFGNHNNNTPLSGYLLNFDSILVSVGSPIDSPGPSPKICYPLSLSSANVQTALTSCASGGNVVLPTGSATWTSQVSATVTGPVAIVGYSQPTAGWQPGSGGSGLAFADGTSLTLSVTGNPALNISGCSATNFCQVAGITATNTTSNSAIGGAINISGTHGQVSSRVDNLHLTNQVSTVLVESGGYGLVDHILYTGSGEYSFASFVGDFASGGYLNWKDATNLGTNQSYIVEDSNFTITGSITDGYGGCKVTIRHNLITGGQGGGFTHGLDSGGYRSCVAVELYNNIFTSNGGFNSPWASRGGVSLFHDNTLTGSTPWSGIELDYYRGNINDINNSGWGYAQTGANWTPATVGGSSSVLNPQATAYQTNHTYAASSYALGSGSNFVTVAGGTTGSSAPSWPGGCGSTVTDNGGVVWVNVCGGTAAPPGFTGTNAGFLSTDNESTCSSGANCTRFLDTNGGIHPFRDQPGTSHGQSVYGCYQWNNSGSQIPSNWWGTDAPSIVQLNRDYFNSQPSGYTSYTYPDPLQGTTSQGFAPPSGVWTTIKAKNLELLNCKKN